MSDWLARFVLRWMKVPPEPRPPAGDEGSVRIFRASKRFYQLNLLRWGISQFFALIGILLALGALGAADYGRSQLDEAVSQEGELQGDDLATLRELGQRVSEKSGGVLNVMHLLEGFGIAIFLLQLPVTYTLVRLDYENRWYLVSDRSLRIREGVWRVNELTLTFANVQEVAIRQGPLQRLLDISDLRVRTAGGGGGSGGAGHKGSNEDASGHVGYFRGVDNAEAIRNLVLERLRRQRDAGLGDPDQILEARAEVTAEEKAPEENPVLEAARGLLEEVRALKRDLS